MDDEAVARLANIVSARVFESMSKFVGVLENIVRENEELRSKVEHLELALFGPEVDDDDFDDDAGDYDDDAEDDGGCDCEACTALDAFFDTEGAQEPEDDDGDLHGIN